MPIKVKVYNQKAETVGEINLSEKVFNLKINEALVHQALVTQMANQRQVLAHTKGRSEVKGGGRKPWRQKGTGRARAGSIRSPIWIGGGITFGPRKERNFKKKINKKMKQKAILMILTDRVKSHSLLVIDKLEAAEYKTKIFAEILRGFEEILKTEGQVISGQAGQAGNKDRGAEDKKQNKVNKNKKRKGRRSILIINDIKDQSNQSDSEAGKKVKYSGRNLAGVEIINLDNINIVDLLKYRNVILTKGGIKKLEEQYK